MSTRKIKYQNINKNKQEESLLFDVRGVRAEGTGVDGMEEVFQQDPNIFLLNNLLMSVQFFENYERDVRLLREHWFKEVPLESHRKKCFYADSLSRLVGTNVRYSPRHGPRKHSEAPLHPLRIYISSDNVEAAYDPSALGHDKRNLGPQYQFTVKADEKKEKSGCVQLVEYKKSEASSKGPNGFTSSEKAKQQPNNVFRKTYNADTKNTRRFTRTEKFIGSQIKDVADRRHSRSFADTTDDVISSDAFYRFMEPEARLKPSPIEEFRMNSATSTSHEIPLQCFQRQEVKVTTQTRRPTGLSPLFRSQNVLNSAAYKGYFCDLLLERLSVALGLNEFAVSMGSVLGEFVVVAQSGGQCNIAPVISIRDWKNFIAINKRPKGSEGKTLPWPSSYMHKVINILPCNVVPVGHSAVPEDSPDYEKDWKIVFPKAEEFLLLHMMHAHVRCYFFALLIYKSFIEAEINVASFGPTHLRHLLFWRVQKNFLAWPEDRPAETLLAFLKMLYRKLQNKSLSDFFITSRNLFATSLPKDLHKAQSLVKKILENPVPFVLRAIRNLQLKPEFYPALDTSKLHDLLTTIPPPEKPKQVRKEKKAKHVHFEDDEEQRWKKNAIKQIQLERKADEENAPKLSVESVYDEEAFEFKVLGKEKCLQVLEVFLSHFLKMRKKSLEFRFSSQAALYLSLAQRLFDSMAAVGGGGSEMKELKEKLNKLREDNSPGGGNAKSEWKEDRKVKADVYSPENTSRDEVTVKETKVSEEFKIELVLKEKSQECEKENSDEDSNDEDGLYETKL